MSGSTHPAGQRQESGPGTSGVAPGLPEPVRDRLARIWRRAYAARSQGDLEELYADWARSYDEDHEAIGFTGHREAAAVLAALQPPEDAARVLDAGAGTGLVGLELAERGYLRITGMDLSEAMLREARRKGVYDELHQVDLGLPLDAFSRDRFDAAILVGVFSFGQAPAHALDEIVRLVRPGGHVVLTMRTDFHEQDAMGVRTRLEQLLELGALREVSVSDPMPYLPRKDPDALYRIWALQVLETKCPEPDPAFVEAVREAFDGPGPVHAIDHAFIWDRAASRLYDRYIGRPEYYLNDCETEILRENAGEFLGDHALCVELGCGSADKIATVFEALGETGEPVEYMPIDVSVGALESTARSIRARFGERVAVHPHQGLFDETLALIPRERAKTVFFLGGSIGNMPTLEDTVRFLTTVGEQMTARDRFIVGFDLCKDAHVIEACYNAGPENLDFFVHTVRRMNNLLGADFDLEAFELASRYVPEPPALGMSTWRADLAVATRRPQDVHIAALGRDVHLEAGDAVRVGISRKFSPDDIGILASLAGLRLRTLWFDARHFFGMSELVRDEPPRA